MRVLILQIICFVCMLLFKNSVSVEPPFGFPGVGRGDLDPLGRGGPGNLFPSPSRPGFSRMNPRFEPFGPDGRLIRADPNPDHLPPPNYNDDFNI